jgi:hypothetical protein
LKYLLQEGFSHYLHTTFLLFLYSSFSQFKNIKFWLWYVVGRVYILSWPSGWEIILSVLFTLISSNIATLYATLRVLSSVDKHCLNEVGGTIHSGYLKKSLLTDFRVTHFEGRRFSYEQYFIGVLWYLSLSLKWQIFIIYIYLWFILLKYKKDCQLICLSFIIG